MKASEFKKLIREEVRKTLHEAYEITLAGDAIKGTGGVGPEVKVNVGNDIITITQRIGSKTSKVMLSKKQFMQLIKEVR
jgi:hypothetical protein